CEKPAHKPIILGKGGSMIKKIGTYARQDIEKMTGHKVFLKLFVKVKEDWRGNDYVLKELGYNPKN
ncbi:MAG: KH domain-containing protein, partial [Bacillota bacterium]